MTMQISEQHEIRGSPKEPKERVTGRMVLICLVAFFAVYIFLIVLDIVLMMRFARRDLEAPEEALAADDRDSPALTY